MNKWLFWLWVFPGIPISILLRNSVAWIVFLSVYAIIVAHLIEWRQETTTARSEVAQFDRAGRNKKASIRTRPFGCASIQE